MKQVSNILLAAGALAQLVSANHQHLHHHRRQELTVVDVVTVVETITVDASAASSTTASVTKGDKAWIQHHHSFHAPPYQPSDSSSSVVSSVESSSIASSSSTTVLAYTAPVSSAVSSASSVVEAAPTTTSSTVLSVSSTPSSTSTSSSTSVVSSSTASSSSAVSSATTTFSTTFEFTYTQPSYTSAATPGTSGNTFIKNGIKAGLSGYVGVQDTDAFTSLSSVIGWYSDYSPTTPTVGNVQGIPMLWNNGSSCSSYADTETSESERFSDFETLIGDSNPEIMFGFYEPDCTCTMSSDMTEDSGRDGWNSWLAPLAAKGTILGSPSMCDQKDESWLKPFMTVDYPSNNASAIDADWDVTSIHINVANLTFAQLDVEYYIATYGKPIWVSEFACVDSGPEIFAPCTDQTEIDTFINDVVPYFQNNPMVVAYGPSNGEGLGTAWPLIASDGSLSATGQTYLAAVQALG